MALIEELQQSIPRPVRPRAGQPSVKTQMFGALLGSAPFLGLGLIFSYFVGLGAVRMTLLTFAPRQVEARVAGLRPEGEVTRVKLHYVVNQEGYVKQVYLPNAAAARLQDGSLISIQYAPGFPTEIKVPGDEPESFLILGIGIAMCGLWNGLLLLMWSLSWRPRLRQRRLIQLGEALEAEVSEHQRREEGESFEDYLLLKAEDGSTYELRVPSGAVRKAGEKVSLLRDKQGVVIYEDCPDESFVINTHTIM